MAARYSNSSPWFRTTIKQDYLDILSIRPVAAANDDFVYTIQPQYNHRPDLLAFDLYGDAGLWWVFIQRNLDVLRDPIFDFVSGTKIFLPQGSKLKLALGL
jgi:hypothetical protein